MKKSWILLLIVLSLLAISVPSAAAPMMTPVPSEMMVTVYFTVTPTGTATQTPTATPTPLPSVCLEITRRTGVRQWPSLWSPSYHYFEPGARLYVEQIVNNQDAGLGLYSIPARFGKLGRYAWFVVEVRGTDYAKVCQ